MSLSSHGGEGRGVGCSPMIHNVVFASRCVGLNQLSAGRGPCNSGFVVLGTKASAARAGPSRPWLPSTRMLNTRGSRLLMIKIQTIHVLYYVKRVFYRIVFTDPPCIWHPRRSKASTRSPPASSSAFRRSSSWTARTRAPAAAA